MSRSPERLDGLATDQSGSTSHCDSHDRTFFISYQPNLLMLREYHFMDSEASEVELHRGACGRLEGMFAGSCAPSCHLGAGWWHAARSARGGLLALDRLAGEVVMPPDGPRRRIPAPPGQHKAPGDLALVRHSRPAGSRRCTRSSASTCGHGSCTSPGCYPRGARPAGVGYGLGRGRRRVVRRAGSDRMGGLAAYLRSRRA
jgi:hypothetical protein